MSGKFQSALLNGQASDWETIQAGVPEGSILEPLSGICDPLETANVLNNDLREIRKWAEQWKIFFNPDPTKQAQEVIFCRKINSQKHPDLYFNSLVVEKVKIN